MITNPRRVDLRFKLYYSTVTLKMLICTFLSMPRAPVKSIMYDTPYSRANQASINLAVELYKWVSSYLHSDWL